MKRKNKIADFFSKYYEIIVPLCVSAFAGFGFFFYSFFMGTGVILAVWLAAFFGAAVMFYLAPEVYKWQEESVSRRR